MKRKELTWHETWWRRSEGLRGGNSGQRTRFGLCWRDCGERSPCLSLCRRESISPALYYQWSKAFLEAGKNGLTVDTKRDATKGEVQRLREENEALKKAVAESVLEVQRLKKSLGM